MSDNTELNQGQDGDVVRLLDKGGVKTQVVALDVGGGGAEALVSIANPMPVALTGFISTVNSSSTPLAAGASFVGEWEDVGLHGSIVVATATDQGCTIRTEFSTDGVNIDSTLDSKYHTDHIEAPHNYTITRQYVRVSVISTSAADQTYLRLQCIVDGKPQLNAPTDSVLAQHFDATVVRPTDYKYEVALGKRQGSVTWNKWGYNEDIDAAATETVWAHGGIFARLTTAQTLTLSSSSVNDTAAGTGTQSVVVTGVDENRDQQTIVVTLNGITPVETTGYLWLGINRVATYLSGSLEVNEGIITVTGTTSGTVQATVPAGQGSTQQAFFFAARGHTVLLDWMVLNITKISAPQLPTVIIKAWVTSLVSNSKYEVFRHVIDTSIENTVELKPSQPFVVGENSLFELQATTDKDNTIVSARFSMIECRGLDV